ncbi:MAG: hypothetical protein ACMG57_02460 [Candidatus Dojkabacteria bacterium]
MNQKTLIFVSCFVLAFICLICVGGFGFIYYLMNKSTPTSVIPPGSIACTLEAKLCPDGSAVGRDATKNCEFKECPATKACTNDLKACPDGSSVGRNPATNCEFEDCPTTSVSACTQDIKICPDGSYVARDPNNSCQFKTCI